MIESKRISRDSLQSVQRAYVFAEPGGDFTITDLVNEKGQGIILRFFWKNGGTTPPRNCMTHVSALIREAPNPLPDDFDFPDIWDIGGEGKPHKPTPIAIGPKGQTEFSTTKHPIPNRIMDAVSRHQAHVWIWGWARYHDVFKDTPEHLTRFAFELVVVKSYRPGLPPTVPSYTFDYNNLPDGTCYDEECTKK